MKKAHGKKRAKPDNDFRGHEGVCRYSFRHQADGSASLLGHGVAKFDTRSCIFVV